MYKYKIEIQLYKIMTQNGVKTVLFQNFVKKFLPVVLLRCIRIFHYLVVLCNGSTSTLLCLLSHRHKSIYYASRQ